MDDSWANWYTSQPQKCRRKDACEKSERPFLVLYNPDAQCGRCHQWKLQMFTCFLRPQPQMALAKQGNTSSHILRKEIMPDLDRKWQQTVFLDAWFPRPLSKKEHFPVWQQNWKLGSWQKINGILLSIPAVGLSHGAFKTVWLFQIQWLYFRYARSKESYSQNNHVSQAKDPLRIYNGSIVCRCKLRWASGIALQLLRSNECRKTLSKCVLGNKKDAIEQSAG